MWQVVALVISDGLVAERGISKKSVQDLLMDYMKKKAP